MADRIGPPVQKGRGGTMMRRGVVILLLVLSLGSGVSAAELHSIGVLDTGAFVCTAGEQERWWQNPWGTIRLKGVTVWMGMDVGGVSDFIAVVERHSQITWTLDHLVTFGWDHYASPTTHGNFTQDFGADYMTLRSGEWLRVRSSCTAPRGSSLHGAVSVTIRFVLP